MITRRALAICVGGVVGALSTLAVALVAGMTTNCVWPIKIEVASGYTTEALLCLNLHPGTRLFLAIATLVVLLFAAGFIALRVSRRRDISVGAYSAIPAAVLLAWIVVISGQIQHALAICTALIVAVTMVLGALGSWVSRRLA